MRHFLPVLLAGFGLVLPATAVADTLADLPDPTRPSGFSGGGEPVARDGLTLYGTRVSARERVAVINGRRVGVGDEIQGATVNDIQAFQVTLTRGGRDITLRLTPPLAKEKR
jgi:hypothetical protein